MSIDICHRVDFQEHIAGNQRILTIQMYCVQISTLKTMLRSFYSPEKM